MSPYSILKNLKYIPLILYRTFTTTFYKDIPTAIHLAKPSDLPRFLFYRILRKPLYMTLKGSIGMQEINKACDDFRYKVSQISPTIYLWKYNEIKCYGTYEQFLGLRSEYLAGVFKEIYSYDWKDKVVVDIGGYVGDSALYFFENGAKKIHIFEPVDINIESLKLNLKNYDAQHEVHHMAVSDCPGTLTLSSNAPQGSLGYGLSEGKYSLHCRATTFSDILSSMPSIDVMKVDCEGGEKYLNSVENSLIQTIPYWIIETHSSEIYKEILNKFIACGFNVLKDISLARDINLLHFGKSKKSSLA